MNVVAKKTSTNAVKKINKQLDTLLKEKKTFDDTASMSKENTRSKSISRNYPKKKSSRKKEFVIVEERKRVSKKREVIIAEDRKKKSLPHNSSFILEDELFQKDDLVDKVKTEDLYDKIEDVINDVSDEQFIDQQQNVSLENVVLENNELKNKEESSKKYSILDILVLILFVIFSILFIAFSCFLIFVCTY